MLMKSIQKDDLYREFYRVLKKYSFKNEAAGKLAEVFTENSADGILSHGVNRFSRFIDSVKKGYVKPDSVPKLKQKNSAFEQWDGLGAAGPLNALFCTDQVMGLAKEYGIAAVGLSNTNHWMRAGTYGWKAAKNGFVLIAWTNTIANMPAWGSKECRLGNNPVVFAVPYNDEAVVLDMAMTQFSYGTMEARDDHNDLLPLPGGYNTDGEITHSAKEILKSQRPLQAGYWKGTGLSLLLDILASLFSGGLSTHEISKEKYEHSVSQVFIAIDLKKLHPENKIREIVSGIINDYLLSIPEDDSKTIIYPGQKILENRKKSCESGVMVKSEVWQEILHL